MRCAEAVGPRLSKADGEVQGLIGTRAQARLPNGATTSEQMRLGLRAAELRKHPVAGQLCYHSTAEANVSCVCARAHEVDRAPPGCFDAPRMVVPWGLGVPPLLLGLEGDAMTMDARDAALCTLSWQASR